MKSRGLVVGIAVVLAAAAAAFVLLYTNGVKKDAVQGGDLAVVYVSTSDIPANTKLTPLIDAGQFTELKIPTDAVIESAVTDLSQLKGQTSTAPILANEQISTSRLSSGEAPTGGKLGISKDHVAVTIELNAPEGGFGNVSVGDNITVYATWSGASVIPGDFKKIVSGQAQAADRIDLPDFTVALIPTVKVLAIQNPTVDPETGKQSGGDVVLTLDLTKQDAQQLVFAEQSATIWTGLLPPGEQGSQLPPSSVPVELLTGGKKAA